MWCDMAERKKVKITDLIINPTNARFVIPMEDDDEKVAMEALCNDKDNHMDRLLTDIAANNLNANELPVIMPSEVYDGKYEVMDGNRRLTCVKLLLQYRNELYKFDIPRSIVNAIHRSTTINVNEEIECVYSDDEVYVNDLLEKLHTHKTGISAVAWKATAQERHSYKRGELTKVNALIRFLETSKYSNESIVSNLNQRNWVHKFKRFINNNKTIRYYFGFEFSKDLKKINMYIHEQEIVRGLGQLLQDSIEIKAAGFAQIEEDRNKYLDSFELQKIVDKSKINDPVLAYHIEDGHISATTITPLPSNREEEKSNSKDEEAAAIVEKEGEKSATPESKSEDQEKDKKEPFNQNSTGAGKEGQSKGGSHKNKTTEARACLIPKTIPYTVSDQRSIDLLNELQETYIKGHRNLIAIGFRSFIEFSVCVFIEKKSRSYNINGKSLLDKIRHTVDKLESIYGQKELKNIIPKIYQLLNTKSNSTSEFGDISMFNLFVHHHKYHPNEDDLKVIYNNYEPYIKLLWDEINKKN